MTLGPRSDDAQADVEVHLFTVGAEGAAELDFAYLSAQGSPDANGRPTEPATRTMPRRMRGGGPLEAGDGLFLYVRAGDDDAFDGLTVRGVVRFWPTTG